jgi:hypothetical protein
MMKSLSLLGKDLREERRGAGSNSKSKRGGRRKKPRVKKLAEVNQVGT